MLYVTFPITTIFFLLLFTDCGSDHLLAPAVIVWCIFKITPVVAPTC